MSLCFVYSLDYARTRLANDAKVAGKVRLSLNSNDIYNLVVPMYFFLVYWSENCKILIRDDLNSCAILCINIDGKALIIVIWHYLHKIFRTELPAVNTTV